MDSKPTGLCRVAVWRGFGLRGNPRNSPTRCGRFRTRNSFKHCLHDARQNEAYLRSLLLRKSEIQVPFSKIWGLLPDVRDQSRWRTATSALGIKRKRAVLSRDLR